MERLVHGVQVVGSDVGARTECAHYRSSIDIIAIKFPCCGTYYPCFECHSELADHIATRWPESAFSEHAVLCGACGHELTISEYLECKFACPHCRAAFNPGCALHYGLYFDLNGS